MREISLIISMVLMAISAYAQQVRIYGRAETGGKPLAGVMIMVFEQQHFYKKLKPMRAGSSALALGPWTILYFSTSRVWPRSRIM
jgi:hypothetical protein